MGYHLFVFLPQEAACCVDDRSVGGEQAASFFEKRLLEEAVGPYSDVEKTMSGLWAFP